MTYVHLNGRTDLSGWILIVLTLLRWTADFRTPEGHGPDVDMAVTKGFVHTRRQAPQIPKRQ